jgi:hypothetical protein
VKKIYLSILSVCLLSIQGFAQCPTMLGAIINGCPGTPTAEGSNEWSLFKTGASAMNIADFRFAYGTPPAYSTLTINGSTAGVWVTQPGGITLTAVGGCMINVLTSGSIPANSNYVMIPSSTTLTTLDLTGACVGGNVYVLFFNTASAGVSGFSATGVFANTPTTPRGFRITDVNTGTCNGAFSTFDYTNAWASNTDGNSVYFPGPVYRNDGCLGVLPLNGLESFSASVGSNKITLNWINKDVSNTVNYEIEKSNDGVSFTKIGAVAAQQTDNYSFVDNDHKTGTFYYRLKINETNGSFYLSSIQKIKINGKGLSINNIYPTPAKDNITFEINSSSGGLTVIEIVDFNGKIVLQNSFKATTGNNVKLLNTSKLQAGMYLIRVKNDTDMITEKIIKQ